MSILNEIPLYRLTHIDNLSDLDKIDWDIVKCSYWADTQEDGDRQRRKQAEFLVYSFCDWSLIKDVVVLNDAMKQKVESIMVNYPNRHQPQVKTLPACYYKEKVELQ